MSTEETETTALENGSAIDKNHGQAAGRFSNMTVELDVRAERRLFLCTQREDSE